MDKLISSQGELTDKMEGSVAQFQELVTGINDKLTEVLNTDEGTDPMAMNTMKQIAKQGLDMIEEWKNNSGSEEPVEGEAEGESKKI